MHYDFFVGFVCCWALRFIWCEIRRKRWEAENRMEDWKWFERGFRAAATGRVVPFGEHGEFDRLRMQDEKAGAR